MNKTSEMWIEWIPNISTADLTIIGDITQVFNRIGNLFVLHIDRGTEVNRTVFTIVGTKTSLRKALFELLDLLGEKVDMSAHHGSHPRIGSLDVCPYVLLQNGSSQDLKNWVLHLAQDLSNEYSLPVYLYEESALSSNRKNLADIRRGEYENLKTKILETSWKPDFGTEFNSRLGATVMGVRDYLIAYNVNLNTTDLGIVKNIANQIRSKGKRDRNYSLIGVKAIGWCLHKSGFCQVSTNITQTRKTSPLDVFTQCQKLAKEYRCQVTGSELIGLIPYHSVRKMMNEGSFTTTSLADHLGLGYCNISDIKDRVIEHKTHIVSEGSLFDEIQNELST